MGEKTTAEEMIATLEAERDAARMEAAALRKRVLELAEWTPDVPRPVNVWLEELRQEMAKVAGAAGNGGALLSELESFRACANATASESPDPTDADGLKRSLGLWRAGARSANARAMAAEKARAALETERDAAVASLRATRSRVRTLAESGLDATVRFLLGDGADTHNERPRDLCRTRTTAGDTSTHGSATDAPPMPEENWRRVERQIWHSDECMASLHLAPCVCGAAEAIVTLGRLRLASLQSEERVGELELVCFAKDKERARERADYVADLNRIAMMLRIGGCVGEMATKEGEEVLGLAVELRKRAT